MGTFFERDVMELLLVILDRSCSRQTSTEADKELLVANMETGNSLLSGHRIKQFKLEGVKGFKLCESGSFGKIWKSHWNGKTVTLKQVAVDSGSSVLKAFHERRTMIELAHPNILQMLGCLYDGDVFFMYENYLGDTRAYANCVKTHHLPNIVLQLLSAVEFIHQRGIIHRDIKPENILLTPYDQIKLAKFENAHKLALGQEANVSSEHIGTYWYSPIETIERNEYSKYSDIYSVGAILFEWDVRRPFIWSRINSYDKTSQFYAEIHHKGRCIEKYEDKEWRYIKNKDNEVRRELLSDRVKKSSFSLVLNSICNSDPKLRPMANEIMRMQEFISILQNIRSLEQNDSKIVEDEGELQYSWVESCNCIFKKSSYSVTKAQLLLGFHYEDPVFFSAKDKITVDSNGKTTHGFENVRNCTDKGTQWSQRITEEVPQNCLDILSGRLAACQEEKDSSPCPFVPMETVGCTADGNECFFSGQESAIPNMNNDTRFEGVNIDKQFLSRKDKKTSGAKHAKKRTREYTKMPCRHLPNRTKGIYEPNPRPFFDKRNTKRFSQEKCVTNNTSRATETNEAKYPCKICGKEFKAVSYRNRHQSEHTRRFYCTKCDKSYTRKDKLDIHINSEH